MSPKLSSQTVKKFSACHGDNLALLDLGITALGFERPRVFDLSVSSQARNQAVQGERLAVPS